MVREVTIEGNVIVLAEPVHVPEHSFIGRDEELSLCRIAWGVNAQGDDFVADEKPPLHFRLQGAPGLGKNELVYEIARKLKKPLYIIQGHEELTPEDLALVLTPDPMNAVNDGIPLILRASPLATALYDGGLFFFDEINRVPERALSPLSSVLDGRQSIYSALTGIHIGARDEEAQKNFRFCCALNPGLSQAGHLLPEYIEQRTLPVIELYRPPFEDLRMILQKSLNPTQEFLEGFENWYQQNQKAEISVRQALALMNYAMSYEQQVGRAMHKATIFEKIAGIFLGRRL
ncbi:AAA family ATPase [Ktedonospora formicarum]|uniref:ATPase dynein-related AAA domain-containing protein n=1 Tax=Ktedonospora formicarum TaxID=2778364 RepID=A0A8J3I7L9_9CHLR|nr:MoxR family ATPase [Ktedonospora formicarum]GHO48961.1 hypothetical protein KSX_71240 [Ktedonospora formicarum]